MRVGVFLITLTSTALMGTPLPMAIMKTLLPPRRPPDNVLTCSTTAVATVWSTGTPLCVGLLTCSLAPAPPPSKSRPPSHTTSHEMCASTLRAPSFLFSLHTATLWLAQDFLEIGFLDYDPLQEPTFWHLTNRIHVH